MGSQTVRRRGVRPQQLSATPDCTGAYGMLPYGVGADSISARGILRSRQMPRDIVASRRGEHCSPERFHAAAHCHGRTMFAPTAHIWLCVGAAKRRRPGNYAHLTGGYRIRPYAWGFCGLAKCHGILPQVVGASSARPRDFTPPPIATGEHCSPLRPTYGFV